MANSASGETTKPIAEEERPREYPCGSRGTLRAIRTDRFKAGQLTFSTVLPITRENAVMAPLMLSVLRRGTERYPALADINRRLDDLYGSALWVQCAYRGDRLILGFGMDLLDGSYLPEPVNLPEGLTEILDQILYHPLLDDRGLLRKACVESEKTLQRDEIRALRNVPAQYAAAQARRIFYEGTPAGIPLYGTEEEVERVTAEQLTRYWNCWKQTVVPECFYVGGDNPEKIAGTIGRVFDRAENRNAVPVLGLSDRPVIEKADKTRRVEEELPVGQSHLVLGYRTGGVTVGHPEWAAAALMTELLGMSPSSLLFRNVREKLSLCYSISAGYDAFRGALFVSCSLSAKNREIAEAEILGQVAALCEGRFGNDELEAARQSLCGAYRQLGDRPASLESFWAGRAMAGVAETPAECRQRFAALTRGDVIAAARRLSLNTVYFLRGTAPEETIDDSDEI